MTDPIAIASDGPIKPTKETYDQIQQAFDYLNRTLFKSELPNCLITLQRRNRTFGYFSGDRFGRNDGLVTDEIALNPSHFHNRPVTDVLATLAHEMAHLWQHHHGKPGRGRYHNREWAERMKAIGLQPTTTGEEGGQEIGDAVYHYVIPDGPFDAAAHKLLTRGFTITWIEKPPRTAQGAVEKAGEDDKGPAEPKSGKRVKYTCPRCQLNAWAKHEARLICGADMQAMEPAEKTRGADLPVDAALALGSPPDGEGYAPALSSSSTG
jgi:predicted SprT family Zn-dependent metalloprotease